MKNKSYKFFVLFLLFISFNTIQNAFLKAQENFAIHEDKNFITGLNVDLMAKRHLANCYLVRKRAKWNYGREFVFKSNNEKVNVFITIGLHQSAEDAENTADNYLNSISLVMKEGPHHGVYIGDKFWWWAPDGDSNNVTNIVFIRKNALFIMSSHNYRELNTLAKKIDDDIIIKANYIELENTILLPIIDSITASKKVLKEGEISKISVHASDPNNEALEYDAIGLSHSESDPENVFTLVASSDYVQSPFLGSHFYKFVVINESNVVSEVAEFEIEISE
jgi:hypothetical protein